MKKLIPFISAAIASLFGCNTPIENKTASNSNTEQAPAWLGEDVLDMIKEQHSGVLEPYDTAKARLLEETETPLIKLSGVVFPKKENETHTTVAELNSKIKSKGCSAFILQRNFNLSNEPDLIAVVNTTDKYIILKDVATDGINFDIDNDSLIAIIKDFDKKYSLDLVGASRDWCEFNIRIAPADWLSFANEVYTICPDVIDQGTETVEELAEEMKNTGTLYLWWD